MTWPSMICHFELNHTLLHTNFTYKLWITSTQRNIVKNASHSLNSCLTINLKCKSLLFTINFMAIQRMQNNIKCFSFGNFIGSFEKKKRKKNFYEINWNMVGFKPISSSLFHFFFSKYSWVHMKFGNFYWGSYLLFK